MINCIVVSDDPQLLHLNKTYIDQVPYLNNLGFFGDYIDVLSIMKRKCVDLIFLDLDTKELNGIEFIRSLFHPPRLILVSRHRDYAMDGFELDAVDFLLKPYGFERFLKACEKVYDKAHIREINHTDSKVEDFIMVKVEHYVNRIPIRDIFYIEGFRDYVKIHTQDNAPILTIKSMKAIEAMLPNELFMRIHRSYIVSVNKITSYRNSKVKVKNTFLSIGESYRSLFQQKILADVI